MKKSCFSLLVTASVLIMFTVSGCKKDKDDTDPTDYTSELTVQSQDQNRAMSEDDAVSDDVNLIADDSRLGGRTDTLWALPCGATVTFSAFGGIKSATITYNDTVVCNGRTRSGNVIVSIPQGSHWITAGAQLTIKANNVKVTRVIDGKSITINGTKTITNLSGGTLFSLSTNTVKHKIFSNDMSITFDDGTQRKWQIEKERTLTKSTSGLVISTVGKHDDGTHNDIAVWGTNRNNNPFSTRYVTPIVIKECSGYRITSGQAIHTVHSKDFTATFGLDASGNPVPSCSSNVLYVKVEWTNWQGNQSTAMVAY